MRRANSLQESYNSPGRWRFGRDGDTLPGVAAVTPERLESTRGMRARETRIRRRRSIRRAVAALCIVSVGAVAWSTSRQTGSVDPGAVASPVSASALDLGFRPPDRVIARAGLVEIHLPIDRQRIAHTLFRPVDDVDAVGLEPSDTWKYSVAPRDGRAGPETAGLDIAAPARAIAYAPVDGTITSVVPYVVAGVEAGYQVDITPDAQSDVIVRVRHIEGIPEDRRAGEVCKVAGLDKPNVGEPVTAGITCIGQVRDATDLLDVARPEIAKYVSGSGNHMHMEVLRVGS